MQSVKKKKSLTVMSVKSYLIQPCLDNGVKSTVVNQILL